MTSTLVSTLFVILLMTIPVIMYIAGKCTVMPADNDWYNANVDFGKKPDIMYNKFGILMGIIFNLMLGASFLYLGKIMISSLQNNVGQTITPSSKRKLFGISALDFSDPSSKYRKTWIDWILFLSMPVMLCLYAIAYPLMCQYHSVIIGAVLNLIPGLFFVLFAIWIGYKYSSWLVALLMLIFGVYLVINSVILFMVKVKPATTS